MACRYIGIFNGVKYFLVIFSYVKLPTPGTYYNHESLKALKPSGYSGPVNIATPVRRMGIKIKSSEKTREK